MSGKAKRILYSVVSTFLWLAMFAGVILLVVFTVPRPFGTAEWLIWLAFLAAVVLRIPAAVHEVGHLLFGWIAGMKFVGVTLSYLRIAGGKVKLVNPDCAGETEMIPRNGAHVRAKTFAFALGGPLLCCLVGGIFLALYFLLPYHIGWLFGALMSIFILYEGLIALYPAELPAGKTDGAVLLGLLRRAPEEEVMLRVLTAQGILQRGTYSDIDRDLLFSAPVVREDLPAFHALLLLQYYYLKEAGDEAGAAERLVRLRSLSVHLTEEERAEIEGLGA